MLTQGYPPGCAVGDFDAVAHAKLLKNKEGEDLSLCDTTKEVYIRCEDCAEAVVFMCYDWGDNDYSCEISVRDSYCNKGMCGIRGRLRRAWSAFWGKPIIYTGVYVEDRGRMRRFFLDCLALLDEIEG